MKDGPITHRYTITHKDGVPLTPQSPPLFVLSPMTDPYARPALCAYAEACKETHPQLAADIRKTYGLDRDPVQESPLSGFGKALAGLGLSNGEDW